ncbi:MAG: hypothetical protein PUI77_03595, partial [Mollicutes bacterium]|nr:hypothetical protein [Mollicutes bacterium]
NMFIVRPHLKFLLNKKVSPGCASYKDSFKRGELCHLYNTEQVLKNKRKIKKCSVLRNLDRLGIYYQRGPELKRARKSKKPLFAHGVSKTR